MGNVGSTKLNAEGSPDEDTVDASLDSETIEDSEIGNGDLQWPMRDLEGLFDAEALMNASMKLISTPKTSILVKHRDKLLSFLDKRKSRSIATVTLAEFCKILVKQSESREDATEVFDQMDCDGDGFVKTSILREAIHSGMGFHRKDIDRVVKTLSECCLIPGFIDIHSSSSSGYCGDREKAYKRAWHLINYLVRNRVFSSALPSVTVVTAFNASANSRILCVDQNLQDLATISTAGEDMNTAFSSAGDESSPTALAGTAGEKTVKKPGPSSVGETMIIWYMRMLTSTTLSCLPVAPHLKDMLLEHAQSAVENLAPLSLSPDSKDKPAYLSVAALHQLSDFMEKLALDSVNGDVSTDWVGVQLSYNLSCGSVIGCLKILNMLDKKPIEMDNSRLLSEMNGVDEQLWKKQCRLLNSLSVIGHDGRQSSDSCTTDGSASLLTNTGPSQQAFLTDEGKTNFNVFFGGKESMCVKSVKIKVEKKNLPKSCLIFVISKPAHDEEFSLKSELETYSTYDGWTEDDYQKCHDKRSKMDILSTDPVAFFTFKGDEANVTLDLHREGRYVLIKFLGAADPATKQLGIVRVRFNGTQQKRDLSDIDRLCLERRASAPSSNQATILETLSFLRRVVVNQPPLQKPENASDWDGKYHFQVESKVIVNQKEGTVRFDDADNSAVGTIVADQPFTKEHSFFEIEIVDYGQGGSIGIGAVPKGYNLHRMPGWDMGSVGYHADDGNIFENGSTTNKARCFKGDKMGCGVEAKGSQWMVYFTK